MKHQNVKMKQKKLKTVPDDIVKLTKLKKLNLSRTSVSSFSSKFWTIKTIQFLDLSHCKFKGMFEQQTAAGHSASNDSESDGLN